MRKKLEVVDFLRGFSITTIVFMHLLQSYPLPSWLMKASSFGGAGAHLFILCSGFGLYLSYLNKPLKYKDFLLKRFGRIYWPMAILCLVTAFWMLYQGKEIWMPLLGNLFLFKMFVPELECSMGGHMWFISTIIQFYIAWPLIVWLINVKRRGWLALVISLSWATMVSMIGCAEERVWNSFFLQYLWEFCLGMKLAELYHKRPEFFTVLKWKYLIPVCMVAVVLTGLMGTAGYPWKLYNDIPSLIGYTSLALIMYKIGITRINTFFCHTNKFSYEWYLVHVLVFHVVKHFVGGRIPTLLEMTICILVSYVVAIGYARLFIKKRGIA